MSRSLGHDHTVNERSFLLRQVCGYNTRLENRLNLIGSNVRCGLFHELVRMSQMHEGETSHEKPSTYSHVSAAASQLDSPSVITHELWEPQHFLSPA